MTHEDIYRIQNAIVTKLKDVFERLYSGNGVGDTIWTQELNKALTILGHDLGFAVYTHDFGDELNKPDSGEWLFDVCWVVNGFGDWKDIRGLALACESEWLRTQEEWMIDFMKLTVVRAPFKLFLFATNHPSEAKKAFPDFKKASEFDSGSHYLVINVPVKWDGNDLPMDSWDVK